MDGNNSDARRGAVDRLRATMRPELLSVSDRMAAIRDRYVETGLLDKVTDRIDLMKSSLVGATRQEEHQILMVHGESHAGKTTLLRRVLLQDPAFQPYEEDYVPCIPLAHMRVPAPCSLRNLAVDGLRKMLGYPVKEDLKRHIAMPRFLEHLEKRRVLFVWLDEAQNLLNADNPEEIRLVANALVSLVQQEGWQVRLVLSGLPEMLDLVDYATIGNRSFKLEVPSVDIPWDPGAGGQSDAAARSADIVRSWVREVVVEHAGLPVADFMGGDFPARLVHACGRNFGSIIRLTRNAVEVALLANGPASPSDCTIDLKHFADAYRNVSNVPNASNMFYASDWQQLPAGLARVYDDSDTGDDQPVRTPPKRKVKALRAGERRK